MYAYNHAEPKRYPQAPQDPPAVTKRAWPPVCLLGAGRYANDFESFVDSLFPLGIGKRESAHGYRVITPQAMRPPLLPVGSVLSSSGLACTTSAVLFSPSSELGPGLSVKALVVMSRPA